MPNRFWHIGITEYLFEGCINPVSSLQLHIHKTLVLMDAAEATFIHKKLFLIIVKWRFIVS